MKRIYVGKMDQSSSKLLPQIEINYTTFSTASKLYFFTDCRAVHIPQLQNHQSISRDDMTLTEWHWKVWVALLTACSDKNPLLEQSVRQADNNSNNPGGIYLSPLQPLTGDTFYSEKVSEDCIIYIHIINALSWSILLITYST